jgi:Ca2+-binding RTX toxin-like protein
MSSLLNVYILPSLAERGGQENRPLLAPRSPRDVEEGDLLMRRRALLILATMGLGVLLLGGVALADTIDGTSGPDDLVGTDKDDVIHARGGKDYLSGLAGPDLLYAGAGNDTVVGREGNDRIYGNTGSDELFGEEGNDTINSAGDGVRDIVKCGQGDADTAYVDNVDWVKKNCENVYLLVRQEGAPR